MSGNLDYTKMQPIEKDFHLAIDRLESGVPTDRQLKTLLAQNKLEINKSTVAKEAKHSRRLIYAYESVMNRIDRIADTVEAEITNKQELSDKWRKEAQHERDMKVLALSVMAGMVLRINKLQTTEGDERARQERIRRRTNPNRVADEKESRTPEPDMPRNNVRPLRGGRNKEDE